LLSVVLGAGKSSIIQAVFQLALVDGTIEIDDVNINNLGLHTFRQKISIIPQDPVLFVGSLRHNLDPFDEKSDDEIWHVLEQVNTHIHKTSSSSSSPLSSKESHKNYEKTTTAKNDKFLPLSLALCLFRWS
jgi:ABC-type transport system involved in cytochrome bd biosynthesis fused ATPase/permease subunit